MVRQVLDPNDRVTGSLRSVTFFPGRVTSDVYPRYTEAMERTVRPGFTTERKLTLDAADDSGVVDDATPAERLLMVWPLTKDCWAFVPGATDHAEQEFQRHFVRVQRGRR